MNDWKPGERVEHPTFGAGTVLESNAQHIVIHFDDRGRRKFASHLVVLKPAPSTEPRNQVRRPSR